MKKVKVMELTKERRHDGGRPSSVRVRAAAIVTPLLHGLHGLHVLHVGS
jgi:hypothetical protein